MNEFKFEIVGRPYSIDELNYKSQFDNIINELTENYWITATDLHSSLWRRGGDFLQSLRAEILNKCKDSTDYELHTSIINKLLNIRSKAVGDTLNPNNNGSDASPNISNYSTIEKLSLAIELYVTEFKETLASDQLNIEIIKIILYLKKGDLDYEDSNYSDKNKIEYYAKWIKNFNQETRQKHEVKNRISKIEDAWRIQI